MPSMMDVRSFGSIRIQSSSIHRLTASNWATFSANTAGRATHEAGISGCLPIARLDSAPQGACQLNSAETEDP